jgi:hypothetical protein
MIFPSVEIGNLFPEILLDAVVGGTIFGTWVNYVKSYMNNAFYMVAQFVVVVVIAKMDISACMVGFPLVVPVYSF